MPPHRAHEVLEGADVGAANGRIVLGPEVERQHLVPGLVAHPAHTRGQPIDAQVVEDHDLAVPGELAVDVYAVHARPKRVFHGIEAVIRPVIAEPSMGEDERARWPLDERASVWRLVPEGVAGDQHERDGEGAEHVTPQPAAR